MFTVVRSISALAARPVFTRTAVRHFSRTPLSQADIVQDLYIKELRQYKPTKDVATEKVDLPTTFTPPPPPPKPEIEAADAQVQATEEDALEEEEWPPLYDPIDDPANYPSNWHLDLSKPEADDGSWYPKPIKAPEYHDH